MRPGKSKISEGQLREGIFKGGIRLLVEQVQIKWHIWGGGCGVSTGGSEGKGSGESKRQQGWNARALAGAGEKALTGSHWFLTISPRPPVPALGLAIWRLLCCPEILGFSC